MNTDFTTGLITYAVLLMSLTVHEWAHAYTAWKLGDPTAKSMGRVSFNPLVHIDPIGTVLLPLFMIFAGPGFAMIGWAKPVPVNNYYFKNRNNGDLLVTGAGPASNLVLYLIMVLLSWFVLPAGGMLAQLVVYSMLMNFALAVFNMIPIPPLDGSHFLRVAIGMPYETFARLSMIGPVLLIVLINIPPVQRVFSQVIMNSLMIWPWIGG